MIYYVILYPHFFSGLILNKLLIRKSIAGTRFHKFLNGYIHFRLNLTFHYYSNIPIGIEYSYKF